MKLRNKKTGEIATKIDISQDGESFWVLGDKPCMYKTLAELNDEWEDYTPAEPLIKDEKVRKAVRAWAEVNEFEPRYSVKYCSSIYALTSWQASIEFNCSIKDLEDGKEYAIAELCGEEEE